MTENLFQAYLPLILWTGMGFLIVRILPQWFPRFLGRALYWVGVPLELIALARQSTNSNPENIVNSPFLVPIITVLAILLSLAIASLALWGWQKISPDSQEFFRNPGSKAGFFLSAVLGNTGFIGLAIAPSLVNPESLNWAVLFSVTHNVVGPYGLGVLIASYFSHSDQSNRWWIQLRDIITAPPLWGFIIGNLIQNFKLPEIVESSLQQSVGVVIACAFLLTGIRLAQLSSWKSLKAAFLPAISRVCITPFVVGVILTLTLKTLTIPSYYCLPIVLMSGMPSAFAGLILAEEYNLDRDLIASSILLSIIILLLVLPLWVVIFN
ncbi:AEC family transporter [Calothrix sp. PCC 6303]|uniref:AEC family transporter n=1 Tax=Calothrix sp. PCC 6303 TaxID=1170562 RepID=UPI0002A02636|nr:AEC family transporter [Calothrix sp. PCC 6303]AFZ02413.1 Auxin Efflux Carrier [Calothrix sp. PCC 6303]